MIIIVMGVAGVGKTTVGQALAGELGWPFFDGDDFHPPANVAKMAHGIPLTDADRRPWLLVLHARIAVLARDGASAVFACSALKAAYRDLLVGEVPGVQFVYLRATREVIQQRLMHRQGHFMPVELLDSQFATLEEPIKALIVDADQPIAVLVREIRHALAL